MLRLVLILILSGAGFLLDGSHLTGATKSSQKNIPASSTKKTSPASKSKTKPTTKKSVTSSTKKSSKKGSSQSSKGKTNIVRGQQSMEPSRIMEIQNALATAGYYKSNPSGQWDDETNKALGAYQEKNGFKVTGKPDALSLKKLGL